MSADDQLHGFAASFVDISAVFANPPMPLNNAHFRGFFIFMLTSCQPSIIVWAEWQSGLMHRFTKPARFKSLLGFES